MINRIHDISETGNRKTYVILKSFENIEDFAFARNQLKFEFDFDWRRENS